MEHLRTSDIIWLLFSMLGTGVCGFLLTRLDETPFPHPATPFVFFLAPLVLNIVTWPKQRESMRRRAQRDTASQRAGHPRGTTAKQRT